MGQQKSDSRELTEAEVGIVHVRDTCDMYRPIRKTVTEVKQLFPLIVCSHYVSKQDWKREKQPSFECEGCFGRIARFTTPSARAKYGEIELAMGKGNLSTPSYHPAEKKIASCFELLQ
jgi:hypothetical protein